jgi:hypothetical protein
LLILYVPAKNDLNRETDMKNTAKPSTNARFTVADLARENNINPKQARRRLRDAMRRNTAPVPANAPANFIRDARIVWEFTNSQRDEVLQIISRD